MASLPSMDTTSLQLVEQGSTPAIPAATKVRLFVRSSDHLLCTVNSSGVVTPWGGALTNPMTHVGALIYGGTAGAPTELVVGSAGQSLISDGTNPSWGHPTLTSSSVAATGDQTIGSADTPTDLTGLSLSLAAGTWVLLAYAQFAIAAAGGYGGLLITDGSNALQAEAMTRGATSALNQNASCAALVTPGSTTTYKLRAQMSGTTGVVKSDPLGLGNKGTRLIAIRLA